MNLLSFVIPFLINDYFNLKQHHCKKNQSSTTLWKLTITQRCCSTQYHVNCSQIELGPKRLRGSWNSFLGLGAEATFPKMSSGKKAPLICCNNILNTQKLINIIFISGASTGQIEAHTCHFTNI